MKKADLHTHSNRSDGLLAPAELVNFMAGRGVSAVALTDHDTVAGVDEALEAGRVLGTEVVAGVELSVSFRHYRDVHVLGYFVDHRNPGLLALLESFRSARMERGRCIVERINEKLGSEKRLPIRYEEVLATAAGAVGRPHIARVLLKHRYVRTMEDAFRKYLEPCNVPKLYIPIEEGMIEIRRSGGVPVLAHPSSMTKDRRELRLLAEELRSMGLEGMEAFCPTAAGTEGYAIERIAEENGLVATGGSDFHSDEAGIFGGVDAEVIERLAERRPFRS
jgi:3',5'-nucleoside bisphosphate phosphatase